MNCLELARQRAVDLNQIMDLEVTAIPLAAHREFIAEILSFLITNEQAEESNNPQRLLKRTTEGNLIKIVLGPQIDKGPSDAHFKFDSGARLSFGITLKQLRRKSHLVAYRFHYVFRDEHSPSFVRFDLNSTGERPALEESRCHFHPGLDDSRLPARVLRPLEVLERIFFVLDKCPCSVCVN